MGGYQWLRLSVGPLWQIGLKFQCRDRSREAGESRRDLRRLGLQAERVKLVPVASAVGAPTGRRLRGGCDGGSWGEGIQWWTGCPDSIARRYGKMMRVEAPWACRRCLFGWEIDKQIQAMALLRHFGVSRGLKFESYVERVALAGGLGSRVNAIPSQGSQGGFTTKVYTKRGNVGHSKRGGGRGRRPTICCGSRAIQQGAW